MYVRTIQDSFSITSRAGNPHQCLVHEVLSDDILSLRYIHPDCQLAEANAQAIFDPSAARTRLLAYRMPYHPHRLVFSSHHALENTLTEY